MSADKPDDDFASLFEAQTAGQRPEKSRPLPGLGERYRAEVVQVGRDGLFVEVLEHAMFGKRQQAFVHFEDARGPDGQVHAKTG